MFLLSSPGVQSVFFFVAPRWAPRPFGGAKAKKNTTQGVVFFFLLRPRRKAGEGEAPPEQKHNTLGGVFFSLAPPKGRGAQRGAKKKKKHFAHPGTTAKTFLETNATGHEQIGATTKKTPAALDRDADILLSGATFPAGPGLCFFFFAAAPRGRSLAHCGPERRCLPPGWCFFFFCCGPARTGVVFLFFCCGPARKLTHSLWPGAISARPGCFFFFFFAAAPPNPASQ